MKRIETERMVLRPWTTDDAGECFLLAKNPNVGPHAGWKPHADAEESRKIIEEIFLPAGAWAVTMRESGRIVGCVGLEPDKTRPDVASRELGYWLAEEYWGKGLMTEAARAVIDYGFETLLLEVLAICTGPENRRSQNVIQKCGFSYEGTLRRSYKIFDGSVRDTLHYSLLREEWVSCRSK